MKYYIKISLQHLAMGLIIPIAIVWKLQNGLSLQEAVLTESIVLLVTAFADLPAGFIANKINNRRSLLLGALFHLVGMCLLALGSSLAVFVLAAIATGLAWAFTSGADEAYIHDDFIESKAEYKKVYATSNIVDEIFTIVGMLAGSLSILMGYDLRILFLGASGLLLLHLAYTFLILPKSMPLPETHLAQATKIFSLNILKNKEVLSIIPIMIAFAIIYEAGRPLWQPQMQALGIQIASFGLIFAVLKLAAIGGSVAARNRKFCEYEIRIILGVMLVALACFALPNKAISIVALCVFLFTENYFRVYMSTVLNKLITKNRAAVLSFSSVIRNGSGAIIIAGAGLVSGISIAWAILAIVVIKLPAIVYALRTQSIK